MQKEVMTVEQESRNKLVLEAEKASLKYPEIKKDISNLKAELEKAKKEDKPTIEKKIEGAEIALEKCGSDVLKARIKACQYIPSDKGAKLELEKPDQYIPEPKERGFIHAELDQPVYNSKTGQKASTAYIQIFDVQSFKNFMVQSARLGYTVKVVWDGEVYTSILKG